ncbi:dihydroorotase [bacterium]|nr:dihydroorotase [bacterium]
MDSLLFKDIEIVTPDKVITGDVLIKNGKIVDIGWDIPPHAEMIVHEPGLTLMPGVIDPHVHLRDPGADWKEDFESGSKAGASGGVTSFFDMPNTTPATTTQEIMAQKKLIASKKSIINYNFYIGATTENIDELNQCPNIPGIKVFMGSSTGSLLVDKKEDLTRIFSNGKRLIAVHAEDEAMVQANKKKYESSTDPNDHMLIRDDAAALKATQLAVSLAKRFNRRLHILHLTTLDEALFLEKEVNTGLITTEVSPQHLLLWGPEIYNRLGTLAQINPPIRTKRHADGLWRALKNGVIQCIATDHAPHTLDEKLQAFGKAPSGMPGIETSLPLLLTLVNQNRCTIKDVCRWTSEAPAQLFGIRGKGRIETGFDADLVLVDLKARRIIKNNTTVSRCGWSAFEGHKIQGLPIATFVNGQMVFREGDFFTDIKGKEIQISAPWER